MKDDLIERLGSLASATTYSHHEHNDIILAAAAELQTARDSLRRCFDIAIKHVPEGSVSDWRNICYACMDAGVGEKQKL